jgi:hypothetical protein
MFADRFEKISLTSFLKLVLAIACGYSFPVLAEESFSSYVDAEGNIAFPQDFLTSMVHLGSWFVPEGEASGFHDVFAEKHAVAVFRESGKFPDGTTLVKELRADNMGNYTTGNGVRYSTENVKQWFVMVKDAQQRFPQNKIWGEGWGWALIKPHDIYKNIVTDFQTDCLGCHVPAKTNDWIYTEAYPVLFNK